MVKKRGLGISRFDFNISNRCVHPDVIEGLSQVRSIQQEYHVYTSDYAREPSDTYIYWPLYMHHT